MSDKHVQFSEELLHDYEKLFGGEGWGPTIESDGIKLPFIFYSIKISQMKMEQNALYR